MKDVVKVFRAIVIMLCVTASIKSFGAQNKHFETLKINNEQGDCRLIQSGDKVKVVLTGGYKLKGKMMIISEEEIKVGKDYVLLSDIESIAFSSQAGEVYLGSTSNGTDYDGVAGMISDYSTPTLTAFGWFGGFISEIPESIDLGGSVFKKKFKTRNGWKISVV